jgi:hypothetical protein
MKKKLNSLLQAPEREYGREVDHEPSTRGAGVQIPLPFLHKKMSYHQKMCMYKWL